jgi:hypothetical protein
MNEITTHEEIDYHCRHVIGAGALALAAAQFGMIRSAAAQSSETVPSATHNMANHRVGF